MVIVNIPLVLFAILDAIWITAGVVMIMAGIAELNNKEPEASDA